jgi:regulator of sirC expression with transglutaminase-like and TPR domain
MLELPERDIDLAKVKLTIDRLIDPSIDVAASLKQLDRMAAEIEARLTNPASSRHKLNALRAHIYQPGPWNDHRPFSYDLADPLGTDIHNKLLPTYLATRKGNCISMPFLFITLGQKLGIDVTASRAPGHVFVKYRDETGQWFSIETTSGGEFARDAWIRQQIPMSPLALSSGIYMQPLTKRETVVVALMTLIEFYRDHGWHKDVVRVARLMVTAWPQDALSMVALAAAFAAQWDRDCVNKYPHAVTLNDLPETQRAHCAQLNESAWSWGLKAESVGWRRPTLETDKQDLQPVSFEQAARRGESP